MHGRGQARYATREAQQEDHSDMLDLLEEDLNHLTMAVLFTRQEEIPVRLQRHTTGVRGRFARVLRKVSRAIVCYSENHHDE